jgi:hypothetical protein
MRAASSHNDSPDQAAAIATRLTGALVNAMLELEESAYTFGVDVVRDGRAAEADGVFQNFPQRHAQSLQFSPGELSGSASWANAGAEEAFVRIDIAHTCEQRLVQQRRLDCELSSAKERGEFCRPD